MRTIDADATIEDAFTIPDETSIIVKDACDAQPTIDVVPVIRCRDCKHYAGDGMYCSWNMIARSDGYCFHANEGPVYADD